MHDRKHRKNQHAAGGRKQGKEPVPFHTKTIQLTQGLRNVNRQGAFRQVPRCDHGWVAAAIHEHRRREASIAPGAERQRFQAALSVLCPQLFRRQAHRGGVRHGAKRHAFFGRENDDSVGVGNEGAGRAGPMGKTGHVPLDHHGTDELQLVRYRRRVIQARPLAGAAHCVLVTKQARAGLSKIVAIGVVGADKTGSFPGIAGSNAISGGIEDENLVGSEMLGQQG